MLLADTSGGLPELFLRDAGTVVAPSGADFAAGRKRDADSHTGAAAYGEVRARVAGHFPVR